jgi:hypothetical protein
MATHSKDSCPCGSGKRYKHCHQPIDAARRRNLIVFGGLVVALVVAAWFAIPWIMAKTGAGKRAVAGAVAADSAARKELEAAPGAAGVVGTAGARGAAAIGVVNPNGVAGPPLRDPNALTLKPPNSGELAPGEHPAPWEYDVARNRYYDPRPGHMHWHSGAPPADPNAPIPAPQVIVTTPDGSPVKVTTSNVQVRPAPAAKPAGK